MQSLWASEMPVRRNSMSSTMTEVLSMEFPWYAQLVDTIYFISDQLLELWTNDEWLTFRNA